MAYFERKHFLTKEQLTDLYWNQGLSYSQIAQRLSCPNVQYWFEKYGIARRPPNVRGATRLDMAGEKNPMFGKKRPDLAEFNRRRKELGYPIRKGFHLSEEAKRKDSEAHKGKKLSLEHRAKISRGVRARLPEILPKMIANLRIRPTRPEKKLINLIEKHGLPFRYVGDGQIIISGLVPDFINVNSRKEIIELFGEYWHEGKTAPTQTEHGRGAIFKEFGYRTLVIWAKELNDEEKVIGKIRAFMEEGHG